MRDYETGDVTTIYFVITSEDGHKDIKAWSDNKDYVRSYMEFHKCKKFSVKEKTATVGDFTTILEENVHDEIQLVNLTVRDPKSKRGKRTLAVPMTTTEINFVNDECNAFMSSTIDYSYLESIFPYLKKKYQQALKDIFLYDAMNLVVHNRKSKLLSVMDLDQLRVFIQSLPEEFGR